MKKLKTFAEVKERKIRSHFIWKCENNVNFERKFISFIYINIKDRLCCVKSI